VAIQAVVCDIEGTTSSISFVHKVLFPLALEKMDAYLAAHAADKDVAEQLENLWQRMGRTAATPAEKLAALAEQLKEYIRTDVKDTTLKWVQGKIWKEAFETGSVKGHVYGEVPEYFRRWKDAGLSLFIYSSGSVEAQQQMFSYSEAGDLTVFLSGYFDTTTGMKRDAASYAKIASATGFAAADTLFLSDIVEELSAAQAAGMQTCLLLREGVQAKPGYAGAMAADFHEVHKQFFR
jgi:enolase-phosphatase E1